MSDEVKIIDVYTRMDEDGKIILTDMGEIAKILRPHRGLHPDTYLHLHKIATSYGIKFVDNNLHMEVPIDASKDELNNQAYKIYKCPLTMDRYAYLINNSKNNLAGSLIGAIDAESKESMADFYGFFEKKCKLPKLEFFKLPNDLRALRIGKEIDFTNIEYTEKIMKRFAAKIHKEENQNYLVINEQTKSAY